MSDPELEAEPVVVLGRGSSLIGGTINTELTRQEIEATLLEGFFPFCGVDDRPERKPRVGVRELGLPFESDPAMEIDLEPSRDRIEKLLSDPLLKQWAQVGAIRNLLSQEIPTAAIRQKIRR